MNAIAFRNLSKRYGTHVVVDGLSLEVGDGSVCGLLGPNGAGKSTAFKCLLGLVRPTSGDVAIDGEPARPQTFEHLAYVPEKNGLYDWLTVGEHVECVRRTYASFDSKRAAELAALFKLDSRKKIKRLSKGQQTAVALCLAFAIRPRVLVLDEPASGLDPIFQRAVLDLIIDAAAGGATVLFSSHQIGQVERAADHVAILRDGRLVLSGSIDDLKRDEKIVEAVMPADTSLPEGFLATRTGVRRVVRSGRIVRAYVDGDAAEVAAEFERFGPRAVDVLDLSLEDIFLGAVSDGTASHGDA